MQINKKISRCRKFLKKKIPISMHASHEGVAHTHKTVNEHKCNNTDWEKSKS